jgi:hypothetical protein
LGMRVRLMVLLLSNFSQNGDLIHCDRHSSVGPPAATIDA